MSYDTQLTDDRRRELIGELEGEGWPAVAGDVADGLSPETVLSRLRHFDIAGEDVSGAVEIVGRYVEDGERPSLSIRGAAMQTAMYGRTEDA